MVNDQPWGLIKLEMDLRQRVPLSSCLFILHDELLSKGIELVTQENFPSVRWRLHSANNILRLILAETQSRMKFFANKKHFEREFHVVDWVYM